ncbi:hypothetical protein ACQKLM_07615 [Bacillus thuringiensis]|uniref:hypothetical protein n=1 Tax=Bacillus thuringiensis TaxID=1428 RepID=UPI003D011588
MSEINYKGFIIKETYGEKNIEEVFKEAYELFYGVEVKVVKKELGAKRNSAASERLNFIENISMKSFIKWTSLKGE